MYNCGLFPCLLCFSRVKTAKHLKISIFQQILEKAGAVIYKYYKNAFDGRCEKDYFKACRFESC